MINLNKECSLDGCNNKYYVKGLCSKHYDEARRKDLSFNCKICSVGDCNEPVVCKGLCSKHYARLRYKGSLSRTLYDPNEYVDHGDYYEIKLYDKDGNYKASAKIDPEDVEKCKQYKWHLDSQGYVISGASPSIIFLHRLVMNIIDSSIQVDHKYNSDRSDDRKSQLRVCSGAQNAQNAKLSKANTSGYKNVSWSSYYEKWTVQVCAFGKSYYFGRYDNKEEAINVADTERDRLHKEFARHH